MTRFIQFATCFAYFALFCSCCRCRLINLQLCADENEDSGGSQQSAVSSLQSTSMNVVQINIKCSALPIHVHASLQNTHTLTVTHTQTAA